MPSSSAWRPRACPHCDRRRVIFWGLTVAVFLRVILAMTTATILEIIGLMFAGGILLLWVSWRLYRDIAQSGEEEIGTRTIAEAHAESAEACNTAPAPLLSPQMRPAIFQIVVADLSMSLDNVLAVAGAAMDHVWVLAIGLVLSIALMGIAASLIAKPAATPSLDQLCGAYHRGVCGAADDLVRRLGDHARDVRRNNSAVASSLFFSRANFRPSGSDSSIARNSSPRAARPFDNAACISPSPS